MYKRQDENLSGEDLQMLEALINDSNDKLNNAETLLMRLCAHYLVNEKRGLSAKDSVANFHLSNGARIEKLNWRGDLSKLGMDRSFGIMVNYLYKISDIEKNHENYVGHGEINHSTAIKSLLKKH